MSKIFPWMSGRTPTQSSRCTWLQTSALLLLLLAKWKQRLRYRLLAYYCLGSQKPACSWGRSSTYSAKYLVLGDAQPRQFWMPASGRVTLSMHSMQRASSKDFLDNLGPWYIGGHPFTWTTLSVPKYTTCLWDDTLQNAAHKDFSKDSLDGNHS